jgi:hypothetical protein
MTNYNYLNYMNAAEEQELALRQAEQFPLDESTVGGYVTDEAHIKYVSENRTEYVQTLETKYLESEHSVSIKKRDDYFMEIAFLEEDSQPLFVSSFDIFADRQATIERLSFIARVIIMSTNFEPATPELFATAERLYDAWTKHQDDAPVADAWWHVIRAASRQIRQGITAADYYASKHGKSWPTPVEVQPFVLGVLADAGL